ncbi:abortive infection family protein [Chryseobacterium gotjawalense]|uniref:Abortive infection family protein n=1 Tax=Chryseobacterium gotjawalense TaxID=3042315 RepID=A0ABY8RD43_9FLAO|nr:abortive infection family protein [Chryseobacterium sp. wdc7]WHF51880.1 abortive infection family protein [Chryseobacterium sp. wdc7]
MQRLKSILTKHSNWEPYNEYIVRIEGYATTDFTLCIENSKALLEGVSKEVCAKKGIALEKASSMSGCLKTAFKALGYPSSSTILQIGTAIANVGQQMGNFRNEIGTTAHGKTVEELQKRQNSIHDLTGNFLIEATSIVCCFLIEAFETDKPIKPIEDEIDYEENETFNDFWDEQYGEFTMSDYSFFASEILFSNDPKAYENELNAFIMIPKDESNNVE